MTLRSVQFFQFRHLTAEVRVPYLVVVVDFPCFIVVTHYLVLLIALMRLFYFSFAHCCHLIFECFQHVYWHVKIYSSILNTISCIFCFSSSAIRVTLSTLLLICPLGYQNGVYVRLSSCNS